MTRPIHEIANDIVRTWKKPYFGARPYIRAMLLLNDVNSRYGLDSARDIIMYFLANASAFRGEEARKLKAELKEIAGIK